MKDFIEAICPKEGQLQKVYYRKEDKDDFYFKMNLMDEDLDLIPCSFVGDDCITIDTEHDSYVMLSEENLLEMLEGLRLATAEFNS
jgi:hypothetical protein